MNTNSYYLVKPNGTMEGPYLVEDLQNLLENDELSISKGHLVIDSATGVKCTIEEATHLCCPKTKTSYFVSSSTTSHAQDNISKEYADITRAIPPPHQYRSAGDLVQSSHNHATQGNRVNQINQFNSVGTKQKNHLVAGIFAFLLGGFGAHKFYNGSWGWGIIYIIFFWTYIPAILALIEGISYLVNQAKYDQKYNMTTPFSMKW